MRGTRQKRKSAARSIYEYCRRQSNDASYYYPDDAECHIRKNAFRDVMHYIKDFYPESVEDIDDEDDTL